MTRRDLRLSSDEYRVAFAGERFGSIYMVEAEQIVWIGHIVEYVIWLIVSISFCHAEKGREFAKCLMEEAYRLRGMPVLRKGSFERGQILSSRRPCL